MLVPVLKDLSKPSAKDTETLNSAAEFAHPLQDEMDLLQLENPVPALPKRPSATDYSESEKTPTSSAPSSPRVRHPEIGHFSTELDSHNPGKPISTGSVTREVFFDNSALDREPPSCAIALTGMDLSNQKNIRVVAKQEHSSEFVKVNLATWDNSVLYSASASWLELNDEHEGWQHGSYNIRDYGKAKKENWRRVSFEKTFKAPPKVVVFLSEVDMDCWRNWRLRAFATDITENGFTIHIDTWADSILYGASATWVAYEADLPKIISGTASTMEIRPWDSPQMYNRGFVEFPEGVFEKTPRVFAGVSSFDISSRKNFRLRVGAETVNRLGMYWKADSWRDTIQYSSGLSYVAME